jgi:2-(1,2-epoxy-1,2-dihydrophenyl)acetyl-CoA isomerase
MFIETADRGPVRWITLNQPDHKNAIPATGWGELREALTGFEKSEQRALVITGAGEDFCSGADLGTAESEFDGSVAGRVDRMKEVAAAALALHRLTKPTLAAVDGVAAGAGMNLALGCDLVIASDRARFTEIFVRRGLTVDFGGTWLLPRLVGLQRARELALTGRIVEADEAIELGLVLEVVEAARLPDAAQELAEALSAGAPIPQMLAKRTLGRSFELSFEEALEQEGQGQVICFATEDIAEGVASFLEKREPRFKGR